MKKNEDWGNNKTALRAFRRLGVLNVVRICPDNFTVVVQLKI